MKLVKRKELSNFKSQTMNLGAFSKVPISIFFFNHHVLSLHFKTSYPSSEFWSACSSICGPFFLNSHCHRLKYKNLQLKKGVLNQDSLFPFILFHSSIVSHLKSSCLVAQFSLRNRGILFSKHIKRSVAQGVYFQNLYFIKGSTTR